MNNTYLIKPDKNFSKRLLVSGIATIIVEILVAIYAFLGLFAIVPITVPIFFVMLLILLLVNFQMFVLVGRNIDKVGVRTVITLIIWLGLVIWLWIFAPIYYLISMHFDALQLRWVVFAFVWEVPLVGGIFILFDLFLFRPIYRFLEGKSSDVSVENIYKRLKFFPFLVGVLFIVTVAFGFVVGTMQQKYFANMPVVEQWKNVINGTTLSFLAGIFISLLIDSYLNKLRSYINREHGISSKSLAKFTSKITVSMMLIIIAGIAMTSMLSFRSAQDIVRAMVVTRSLEEFEYIISLDWSQMSPEEREHELNHTRRGARGVVFIENTNNLDRLNLLDSNRNYIRNNESGVVDDYQFDLKTIVFDTNPVTGEKIVSVIYITDFYDRISAVTSLAALGFIFVVITVGGIILFYRRAISNPLILLLKSVRVGDVEDKSQMSELSTGDEFEELSDAILDYKTQIKKANIDLEIKVEEQTKEMSTQLIDIEKKNVFLEDTKKAVFNILEDAQELQIELKQEKEGVEKKVEERTKALSLAKDEVTKGWVQLQKEKARLSSSIESLSLGFIMTDVKNNIVISNPSLEKILGFETHKWTLSDITKEIADKVDIVSQCRICMKEKKTIELKDIEFGAKYLKVFLAPIMTAENEVIGSVILIEDITEAKVLERSRDEFFSIASHELRTPLTSIKGNTSMIQQYYADKIKDNDLKDMINDIYESSNRLIDIVNDFLDMSRLEQGRIEFENESFDAMSLVEKVVYDIAKLAEDKKIFVTFDKPKGTLPKVFADSARVQQIIFNLLGNAIKFTAKGGVTVVIDTKDKFLYVHVTDTGQGIPVSSQSLLFRKFQQAENNILTRDGTKGTGLGLYISKLMAEGMGGTIFLEKSIESKGSTFTVTLPLATGREKVKPKVIEEKEPSVLPDAKPGKPSEVGDLKQEVKIEKVKKNQ